MVYSVKYWSGTKNHTSLKCNKQKKLTKKQANENNDSQNIAQTK